MGKIWNQLKDLGQKSINDRDNFMQNLFSGIGDIWNNITGRTSKELAEKNFNMQQEQYDYQKQLNETMMEREDTAYQRAVKDANSAGISALSVSGGAAAGAGTSAEAPQINDYAQNQYTNGLNLLNSLTQFENNIQQQIINKKRAEADIRKTNAETADIEAHTDLFNYQLPFLKIFTDYDYNDKTNKNNFFKAFGGFTGANPYQEYSILKNLNPNQYADIIRTNEFDKIGMLYSIIQDVGKHFGINNLNDVKDSLDKLPKLFNNFLDVNPSINNNKLVIPSTTASFFETSRLLNPKDKEDKLSDKKATATQQSIEDIKWRDEKGGSKKSHKSGKIPEKKKSKKRSGQQE